MVIEPKKKYNQVVKRDYKITNAVLDLNNAGKGHTNLLLTIGDKSFVACTLSAANPQCALSLRLSKSDQISFSASGEGHLHLTGYILGGSSQEVSLANGDLKKAAVGKSGTKHKDLQKLLDKTMSDSDEEDIDFSQLLEESDDALGEEEGDDDDDDDLDSMGDDDEDDDDEEDDDEDDDEEEDDDEDDDDDEDEEDDEEVKPPPTKKEKKEQKPQQQQQQQKKAKEEPKTNGAAKLSEKVLTGNVKITDQKEGTGAFAKPGKKVFVHYIGRLQSNNQVFDSQKNGAGFSFMLGRGTVIKGWDIGVS